MSNQPGAVQEFLLKGLFPVMRFLPLNVLDHRIHTRGADGERPIFLLPRKPALLGKGFMHPFRGTALDKLHGLRNRHGGWEGKQEMHMVRHAADFNGLHPVLPRDAAQKGPEPFAQGRCHQGTPLLGAEDAVMVGTDVGHGAIQPSLRDLCNAERESRRDG